MDTKEKLARFDYGDKRGNRRVTESLPWQTIKSVARAFVFHFGNTTYIVNVKFAPNCKENISDVVRRLIERDIKKQAA